ncbi:MAG: FecR domain-containing protein [Leptospiraceae bacterium]|nr:FecR domain-containing protein [Leptospiraceae bacterium]
MNAIKPMALQTQYNGKDPRQAWQRVRTGIFALSAFASILLVSPPSQAQTENRLAALVVRSTGTAHYIRGEEKKPLAKDTILYQGDVIEVGAGESFADVQLSETFMCRVGKDTRIAIDLLQEASGDRQIQLNLSKGEVVGKLESGGQSHNVQLFTPTSVAAVRGTEFIVESDDDSSSVLVNEGEVNVSNESGASENVSAGNKATSDGEELIVGIMEAFEKQRFEIVEQFEQSKKANFEMYMDQVRRNQELMDQMRNNR